MSMYLPLRDLEHTHHIATRPMSGSEPGRYRSTSHEALLGRHDSRYIPHIAAMFLALKRALTITRVDERRHIQAEKEEAPTVCVQ